MKKSLFIAGLLACGTLYGQNPIVPPGVYLADPEGHQWKDGKLYLYVSRVEVGPSVFSLPFLSKNSRSMHTTRSNDGFRQSGSA